MENPGPGAYEITRPEKVSEKAPSFGIGTEVRGKERPSLNPGPGMYEVRGKLEGRLYGFGSEKREKEKKVEHPGFVYNPPSTFANIPKYLANR